MKMSDVAPVFSEHRIEPHGCARGRSGACYAIGSKRDDWDHGDKARRTFTAINLRDPNAQWITFKISVSQAALACSHVQKLTSDREQFLLQAGLTRFRRFLAQDDAPERVDEFTLLRDSPEEDFEMLDRAELQREVARVRFELLDTLWTNRHTGVKRTHREDLQATVCTLDSILHPALASLEASKFITGAHGVSGIKILPDGETELERLRASRPVAMPTSTIRPSEFDVFISHASEDKDTLVRPLVQALRVAGVNPWYDEIELSWGASLRRNIDSGLATCRFGVVVLSHAYFKKDWAQRELDGLFAKKSDQVNHILPIWHGLTAEEVATYSPMMADLRAIRSSVGIEAIVKEVLTACRS